MNIWLNDGQRDRLIDGWLDGQMMDKQMDNGSMGEQIANEQMDGQKIAFSEIKHTA